MICSASATPAARHAGVQCRFSESLHRFAYVLNYQIITSEGATIASTVTYLVPAVAIVLGVLVLDESITVYALAGIALVLAG